MMMIERPMYLYGKELKDAFLSIPFPERFNDHGLGVRTVKFLSADFNDQSDNITSFIYQTNLANRIVAKWFNWDKKTGACNMDLIKQRGLYNASQVDKFLAAKTIRGKAMLEDAGENLIADTYLIMNDISYDGDYSSKEIDANSLCKKNFKVIVTSYIYQLNWNDSILYDFYENVYDNNCVDFLKNKNRCYNMSIKASVTTTYEETSHKLILRDLIRQVVGRAIDINLVKLQKSYPRFRIKAPLISTNPIRAYIGLKEGVEEKSLFEVLETIENEDGSRRYERVGIIAPKSGKIWDNRYMVDKDTELQSTEFKIVSGKGIVTGMLIREIDNRE